MVGPNECPAIGSLDTLDHSGPFDPRFKIFHELMQKKIREVLLVSTLYDACIMEEDGRLAERINNEYRGLNLSQPPRLTWASTAEEAMAYLSRRKFDLVITMPRVVDMDAFSLGEEIKNRHPEIPVFLLLHRAPDPTFALDRANRRGIDRTFVWTGNSDLLLAIIKSVEDKMNVDPDVTAAGVRVILFVEDSPLQLSLILPTLYREIVRQTQAVMEECLNEEHKLLTMRARPKILMAENYEEALDLYGRFKPYLLSVFSDVRFPRNNVFDKTAGIDLLTTIKKERPDVPLLLMSSEEDNRKKAEEIPAFFLDKTSPSIYAEMRSFLIRHLGFGDFIFRYPDGREFARVSDMHALEKILPTIPSESFYHHWSRNDFSTWLFARSEIILASRLRPVTDADFGCDVERMRRFIISLIHTRRMRQLKGVVASFETGFDPDVDFLKIGLGSLGGKARGLVFISSLLHRHPEVHQKFPGVRISFPKTLVLTTEGFDSFMELNGLRGIADAELPDSQIASIFLGAGFPAWFSEKLRHYLQQVNYPLAVRSSSLLEDNRIHPYAGLYRTYMLPNNHPDLSVRLEQLLAAIKLIYASTYYEGPRSFARSTTNQIGEEKMAVIVQRLVGRRYGDFFYPALSGVAQSRNFYPVAPMKPEEGIAHIALGLGKTVMDGGRALRFAPRYPQALPQFSTVVDILRNSQRDFWALAMNDPGAKIERSEESTLRRREIREGDREEPVLMLSSTYDAQSNAIRDTAHGPGHKVVTFAQVLKYGAFPLPGILEELLAMGQEGMGAPVEFEFSVDLDPGVAGTGEFAVLQIRPMTREDKVIEVEVFEKDLDQAFCFSSHALGNGIYPEFRDLVFVKPESFDPSRTPDIAREIGRINRELEKEGRKYLLIGPGRWGSADRWLGIPVAWQDISGVGAIVETRADSLNAEPSQGSHFFHNITTLGIPYVMVTESGGDFMTWDWLRSVPMERELEFVGHVRLEEPVFVVLDGRKSRCMMLPGVPDDVQELGGRSPTL